MMPPVLIPTQWPMYISTLRFCNLSAHVFVIDHSFRHDSRVMAILTCCAFRRWLFPWTAALAVLGAYNDFKDGVHDGFLSSDLFRVYEVRSPWRRVPDCWPTWQVWGAVN